MAEMTWTLRHTLSARLTLEVPINSAQPRIHQSTNFRLMSCFIHDFGMLNLRDRVCFLLHRGEPGKVKTVYQETHDFLGREDTKLHLFHFANGSRGIGELMAQHGGEAARVDEKRRVRNARLQLVAGTRY